MEKEKTIRLRVTAEERAEYFEAAKRAGMSLSCWIRVTLSGGIEQPGPVKVKGEPCKWCRGMGTMMKVESQEYVDCEYCGGSGRG